MSTASKGRKGEHEVRDLLKEAGYLVIRAAGSKGCFDLVALPTRECSGSATRVIQVKRGRDGIPKEERVALELLGTGMPGIKVEVWHRRDRKSWKIKVWDCQSWKSAAPDGVVG